MIYYIFICKGGSDKKITIIRTVREGFSLSEIINAGGNNFFENIAKLIEGVRSFVGRTADLTMSITVTYFEIGRMIVEEE